MRSFSKVSTTSREKSLSECSSSIAHMESQWISIISSLASLSNSSKIVDWSNNSKQTLLRPNRQRKDLNQLPIIKASLQPPIKSKTSLHKSQLSIRSPQLRQTSYLRSWLVWRSLKVAYFFSPLIFQGRLRVTRRTPRRRCPKSSCFHSSWKHWF